MSLAEKLSQHYQIHLSDELCDWFDGQPERRQGGAEFRQALSVGDLIEPAPGIIWAGFMLPDTLPLVGNHYGDWLCLRIGFDGQPVEMIHWYHGGGDWTPYGNRLSEALIYDLARWLAGHRSESVPEQADFGFATWARQWCPIPEFWSEDLARADVERWMHDHHIARVALQRDQVAQALLSPLGHHATIKTAQQLGVAWEPEFVRWLFDAQLCPSSQRATLLSLYAKDASRLFEQDWDTARQVCQQLASSRNDLAWPFDLLGWWHERNAELPAAIRNYQAGIRTSIFSDDTVRFRTHWFPTRFGKFSAFRLFELRDNLSDAALEDPYLQLFWNPDHESLRARVRDYWLTAGDLALEQDRFQEAYQHYYRAGWDLGLQYPDSYQPIYRKLIEAAERGGSECLARIGRLHERFLR